MSDSDRPDDLDAGWELSDEDLSSVEEELEPYDSDEATMAYGPEEVPEAVAQYLARADAVIQKHAGPEAEEPEVLVDLPPEVEEPEPPVVLESPAVPERRSTLDPELLFDLDDLDPPADPQQELSPAELPSAPNPFASPFNSPTGELDAVALMAPVPMALHLLAMIIAGVLMTLAGTAMMAIALLR